jgi:hypothetical protein
MSLYAIYIPSVYANITESMISKTFHRMEIGKVQHVELINGSGNTNRAHVFFSELYDTDMAKEIKYEISNNKTSKLSYAKNQHVFWIMLSSRREYDGKSNAGEYVENTVEFTDEEVAFMDAHRDPDMSLVDVEYAESLETELYNLRNQMAQLQMNNQILFNEYNMLLSSHRKTCDVMDKWVHLAENNQMARLRRAILPQTNREVEMEDGLAKVAPEFDEDYVPNTSKMTIDELNTDEAEKLVEVEI